MHVKYEPDHVVSDASVKEQTGQSFAQWFAELDAQGGPPAGRRVLGVYLFRERKVDAWWSTTILVEYEAANAVTEKDGHPNGYNICVTKSIAAPIEDVFKAFASGDWLGKGARLDFREGGEFADKEGHHGSFVKINAPKMLRFLFRGEQHGPVERVEIKLAASGAKCGITLNHERCPTRDVADGMRKAWSAALTEMKQRLEA